MSRRKIAVAARQIARFRNMQEDRANRDCSRSRRSRGHVTLGGCQIEVRHWQSLRSRAASDQFLLRQLPEHRTIDRARASLLRVSAAIILVLNLHNGRKVGDRR
jgi:predicted DNA-binding ribbon-helix-helix protein